MQTCTSCNKAYATIHVLDLEEGKVKEERHLCSGCAEVVGVGSTKSAPLTLQHNEMLELIGSLSLGGGSKRLRSKTCPGCGLSAEQLRKRGRVGCPRCYDEFRTALLALLERVHDATRHCGRVPGQTEPSFRRAGSAELQELRMRLAAAVDAENYEEAASLRDRIRAAEQPAPPADSGDEDSA